MLPAAPKFPRLQVKDPDLDRVEDLIRVTVDKLAAWTRTNFSVLNPGQPPGTTIVSGTGVVQATAGALSTRPLVPGEVLFGGADTLIDQDPLLNYVGGVLTAPAEAVTDLSVGGAVRAAPLTGRLSVVPSPSADWTLANPRIYAVRTTGDDAAAGFADAASSSAADVAAATVAAGLVAKRTIAGLAAIVPRNGDRRKIGIVVESGTYAENIDQLVSNLQGYLNIVFRVTGTNATAGSVAFAGDINDLIYTGAVTVAGMNAAGYNPIGSPTTSVIQLRLNGGGAAALPAEPAAPVGWRLRFDNNAPTQAALRNVAVNVSQVSGGDTITAPMSFVLPAVPVGTDVCYLEQAGGVVQGGQLTNSNLTQEVVPIPKLVGFRFTTALFLNGGTYQFSFCGGTSLSSQAAGTGGKAQIFPIYDDVSGLFPLVGGGFRASAFTNHRGPLCLDLSGSVWTGNLTFEDSMAVRWADGAMCSAGISLSGIQGGAQFSPSMFGALSGERACRIIGAGTQVGGLILNTCRGLISGISITGMGAKPAIKIVNQNFVFLNSTLTGSSGNTDVGLDLTASVGSTIYLPSAPTVTGTAGDVRLAGGQIITWAQARAGVSDVLGNQILSTPTFPFTMLPVGAAFLQLAAGGHVSAAAVTGLLTVSPTIPWGDITGAPAAGAPLDAHYLTSQAEAGLTNEVNLGALTSGVLQQTVVAGVSTPNALGVAVGLVPFGHATNGTLIAQGAPGIKYDVATESFLINTPTTGSAAFQLQVAARSGVAAPSIMLVRSIPTNQYAGIQCSPDNNVSKGMFLGAFGGTIGSGLANSGCIEFISGGDVSICNLAAGGAAGSRGMSLNNVGITTFAAATTGVRFLFNTSVASAAGAVWNSYLWDAGTLTVTGGTTVTELAFARFAQPIINGAFTVTDTGTVVIDNAPTGTSTRTNSYALWAKAGAIRFGNLVGPGIVAVSATGLLSVTAAGGSNYQTIQNAGVALTQRAIWNASTGLTAVDNPGSVRTDVTVNLSTGVAGGQNAVGGTGASESLGLVTTTHGTKGFIRQASWWELDETNARMNVIQGAFASWNTGTGTDFERVRQFWNANVWNLTSEAGGTGTVRGMLINAGTAGLSAQASTIAVAASTGNVTLVGGSAGNLVMVTGGSARQEITTAGEIQVAVGATQSFYNVAGANLERARFWWDSNVFVIGAEETGSGTLRTMEVRAFPDVSFGGTGTFAASYISVQLNANSLTSQVTLSLDSTTAGTEVGTLRANGVTRASSAGVALDALVYDVNDVSITGTTTILTAAGFNAHVFKAPNLITPDAGVVVDLAATVYIDGPPNEGTNVNISNGGALALHVNGPVRINDSAAPSGLNTPIFGFTPGAAAMSRWGFINYDGTRYRVPLFEE